MTTIEGVGWVLLHFVWQGLAIALVLAALLALTSAAQAKVRYLLSCTALALMLISPTMTALSVFQYPQGLPAAERNAVGVASTASSTTAGSALDSRAASDSLIGKSSSSAQRPFAGFAFSRESTLGRATTLIGRVMPWLVAVWALGVLLLSVRLVGGWWRTRGLRLDGVSPVPAWCEARLVELAARLHITRPVAIVSSIRVAVPIVLGHLRPVIVIPAAVIAGVNAPQLEAIIAHELAHVRRHDYLVNLIQTVVETLLFYHPAVWWVSRHVRETREHCCDDLAVTVCASREGYVRALLGLEELRTPQMLLAPAATDGTLLTRARRLLIQPEPRPGSPRLAASVIALTVVAAATASASLAPTEFEATDVIVGTDGAFVEHGNSPAGRSEATEAALQAVQDVPASSIAQSPDTAGSLANRWAWAERTARDARHQRYWVGYSIAPVRTLPAIVYLDRLNNVVGDSMQFSGHLFSTVGKGVTFPGRRLVVPAPEGSLKILLAIDTVRGTAVLTAVHVSSISLPVDTKDQPIYWLGPVDASQSIANLGRYYERASTQKLQSDVMAAIGVHDASTEIVAWLERRVASNDADTLRGDAAEWIAWHPIARSLTVLDRIARNDRSVRVRQEAAEGLGDLAMPEAAPVLIALARSTQDAATRMEAVEALGARAEPAARDALDDIARRDQVPDIQREAVETLGDLSDDRGLPNLLDLARTHPDAEIRREAVETLGSAQASASVVEQLKNFALSDQDLSVQSEAIETLADLPDAAGLLTLLDLVQSHPQPGARREAVESLGDLAKSQGKDQSAADPKKIVGILGQLARNDRDVEVQAEAVETLGDIGTSEAVAMLQEIVSTHPDERIRAEAVESLGDTRSSDLAPLLKRIALEDKSSQVQHEAIETLEGLPDGAGIDALLALAREHPDTRARKDALEALIDSEQPRAREVVERFLKQAGR